VRPAVEPQASDLDSDLRKETGIPAADERRNEAFGQEIGGRPREGKRAIAPPCRTDFSGHVYSDRAPGVTPTEFVLHYTVSANRAGWGDVLAIRDFFERTRLGSAHFLMDFEGHCLRMVPGSEKAWTQGNANSYAYSVEIIATGQEPRGLWKESPIFRQRILARLVRSVMDAHGLPLVRVDPVGCVFPPGYTDHNHLECGNNHTDVAPHFPFRLFARQLRTVR
jgi:N-acetyl-anhydromuramyl-L-alanine amidase AmpD